ncbi:loricrin-like [Nilaparvata lugens]|uniref:loricrin-like n=1 Tax=Nilaparvata lugens TaxID=108931 RepID=UPI00193D4289|nr:loricrin-like [Nilaparvata lugens]
MLLIKIFLLVVFTLQTHSERDPNWARGGPWGPPAPGNMYWDSKNTLGNDRGGGGGDGGGGGGAVGGGLIGVVDGHGGGGGGWDEQGGQGGPGCSRCTVLHDAGAPNLSDGGFGNSAAGPPGGPPGGGGPSSIPQYPPGYRGNGYDNFSPEWKLREVLQQQGAGTAPLTQVAAGGWKKDHHLAGAGAGGGGGSGGGTWSGTIRPIEPNYRRPNSFPWPPSSSHGGPWGPDTIPSGWGSRGPGPRKLDETFRVSSGVIGGGGGPPSGGAGGNWVAGASGYKGGPMGAGYQGGGHGGYDEYGGNKVQGQTMNVHSGFRHWAPSGGGCQPPTEPPPMRGGQPPSGGCGGGPAGVPGMDGWGSGAGYATNWDHGRPVEPRPMEPYAPREPNINNPSNTDPRWMTRGPSWGFRDPPFGADSREPGFNPSNQNWNKVSGPSLTVSSGYPEPPSRPPAQKDPQSWGYGSSGAPWPSRGPPPQKYPASFAQKDQSFGGSARRPGFGCRDLGCGGGGGGGVPAQQPWGGGGGGGGGGWAASGPTAPSSNRQPPYWGDKQPPPGAPSGFKPGYGGQGGGGGGGYPAQDQGGYMQQGYPAQSQGYPGQGILHKDLPRRTHHREHILQEVEDTMRHQMERVATRADQEQVVISRQGEVDQV